MQFYSSFQRDRKKGFTIIELLVVIAIIGILSALITVSLNTSKQRGRDAKRVADIKQISLSLELYYQSNAAYPSGTTFSAMTATLIAGNYLASSPVDPINTGSYQYKYLPLSSGQGYHVAALLEQPNEALNDDADYDSTGTTGGFKGVSSDCATGTGTEECFDLKQ